jgi:type IV fimbrial biogenesis protein FimT/type IV fimbrial biogenesis protein FimU
MVELLVTIAILAIISAIALPSFNDYLVKTRVDNEISKLHRLILVARNTAINSGRSVTICPLTGDTCGVNWQGELSVFTNATDNSKYDSATEELIKVKAASTVGDTLVFNQASLVYAPTGRLVIGADSLFSYCPNANADFSRGINISLSGRVYASQDTDSDSKDEDRSGNEITCS